MIRVAFAAHGQIDGTDGGADSDMEWGTSEDDELFGYHELELFGWWDLSGADDL